MATLTSQILALITYVNEVTGKDSASLGDAIKDLADGYNGGGTDYTLPHITDAEPLGSQLTALIAYANGITGESDATIGDAVRTLSEGYGSKLPKGYTECEYLESTGTQYIELPFGFYKTDELNIKFSLTYRFGQNDRYVISPKKWNDNNNRFAIGMHKAFDQNYYAYTCAYGSKSTGYTYLNPLFQYVPEMIVDVKYSDFLFTSTILNNSLNVTTIDFGLETANLKLFYGYSSNTSCRIYEYNHKKNNKFVCNFVPALDQSGMPCMYDTVSKRAFYNSGTGEFLYKVLEK